MIEYITKSEVGRS